MHLSHILWSRAKCDSDQKHGKALSDGRGASDSDYAADITQGMYTACSNCMFASYCKQQLSEEGHWPSGGVSFAHPKGQVTRAFKPKSTCDACISHTPVGNRRTLSKAYCPSTGLRRRLQTD
jgi:hypothetical protein